MLLSKCETLYRTKEVIVRVRAVWDGSGPHRVCIRVCVCVGCNKFLSSLCRHERLGRQPEQKPFKQKRDDVRLRRNQRPSPRRTVQSGFWILATPTFGPPFFPWRAGPRGQHLQRAAVRVGGTSHHPGGRRSWVRKRRVKAKVINKTRLVQSLLFALRNTTWHLQAQRDSPASDSGVQRKLPEWWIRLEKSLEEIRSGRARWGDENEKLNLNNWFFVCLFVWLFVCLLCIDGILILRVLIELIVLNFLSLLLQNFYFFSFCKITVVHMYTGCGLGI